MDEYLGRQHEEEVLQAFERVQDEFRALTEETEGDPLPPETDLSAGDSAAVYAAGEPLTGRSARHAGSRSKKPAKPQKETKAETKKPVEKKPEKPKKKKKKGKAGKIILGILLFFLLAGVIAAGVAGHYVLGIIEEAPEINPDNLYDLLAENSVVFDADGNVLENLFSGDSLRSNLEYKEMPQNLINAFVSFYDRFKPADILPGIVAVVSVQVQDPVFESQSKIKLGSYSMVPDGISIKKYIGDFIKQEVYHYLYTHADIAEVLDRKMIKNSGM